MLVLAFDMYSSQPFLLLRSERFLFHNPMLLPIVTNAGL